MPTFATTLAAAVNATQAKILVDDAAATDGGFYVQIDEEFLLVNRGGATIRRHAVTDATRIEWQVARGQLGTVKASHADEAAVTEVVPIVQTANPAEPETSGSPLEVSETYAGTGSHQTVAADLELDPAAGQNATSKYLGAIMGNILGVALTKTKPIIAALIGKLSVTGARSSTYSVSAVRGEVGDGVTEADGAFVAVLGGDSEVTTARAAYTVDNENSTPGSEFDYGLDLAGPGTHDGYPAIAYAIGDIRLSDGGVITGTAAFVEPTTATPEAVADALIAAGLMKGS